MSAIIRPFAAAAGRDLAKNAKRRRRRGPGARVPAENLCSESGKLVDLA
jgi:hypothetical protein